MHKRLEVDGIATTTADLLAPEAFPAPVCLPSTGERVDADEPLRIRRLPARTFKRACDLAIAIPLTICLLLLLPILALIIRLDSPGRVLFSQERIGRDGRRIRVFKLRSMHADAEDRLRADPALYQRYVDHGFKLPESDDPRITRVGRVLRKTSLDELPQAFSVLVGDMSVVGPRPVVPVELHQLYGDQAGLYLVTKPGLTGLWQVSGRSKIGGARRVGLDRQYVDEWSPVLDVSILLRTIPAVLTGRGAH